MYCIWAMDKHFLDKHLIHHGFNKVLSCHAVLVTFHWTVIFFKMEQSHHTCTMKMMRTSSEAMSGG